jgi:uncharacterized protein (DUF1684 family)
MRSSVFFIFLSFLNVLSSAAFVQAQTFYGADDLKTFREGRDKEFRNKAESPLLEEDFSKFKGLNYFDEDKSFRVEARFQRTADENYFQMPTSSGVPKKYIKYGVLKFKLENREHQLNIYQMDKAMLEKFPEYADLLFVPFKDATNGAETYGGGRYIDIKAPKGNKVILDFNLAYNPSCAYGSDRYSCPIPPKKNFLKIDIKAGEKSFEYFGKKH